MTDRDPLANLLPSLIQCFTVILIGYLAVRLSVITSQANAIGTYVTKFALPALFFRSMAYINFSDVNWLFILAVSLGKLVLFVITIICTILITRPINFGMAGILSMFITQSNDVALGYPILLSLYPDLAKYIYLFAPAQLVFINPLCFALLEWHEYRTTPSAFGNAVYVSPKRRILLVVKNVVLNPLVFMTVIGVIFNFLLNHRLPLVLDKVLGILADSFSGVALFYLGMNMVGKMNTMTKKGIYVLVLLLLGKLIFLPFLTRELAVHLVNLQIPSNNSLNYSLMAFLYGGLPTAPPVFLVANSFQVLPDLIATGLVLGTFLSGPLMFITARVITMVVASKSEFDYIIKSTAVSISVISLVGCIWVLVVFLLSRRCRSPIHKVTILYTFYVILTCSGVVVGRIFLPESSNATNKHASWGHYFQFTIFFVGCVGTRLCTIMIAATMLIIKQRSVSFLIKYFSYFYIIGFCVPAAITALLLLSTSRQTIVDIDPTFPYGNAQLITSLVVLTISIISTITCIIMEARTTIYNNEISRSDSPERLIESETTSINNDIDNNTIREDKSSSQRKSSKDPEECQSQSQSSHAMGLIKPDSGKDDDEFQIHKHLALTIILVVTMGFGLFLCLWRLIREEVSGIYIELEFLDCVFNFGQGFIIWAIFGLDTELIVVPFKRRIMTLWNNIHEFYVPPESNVSVDVARIKKQFVKYHLKNCRRDIVKDVRYKFKLHTDVLTGKNLVDWIIRIGLATNRLDAIGYGQALLIGRVIEHVTRNRCLIDDDESLYRFVESIESDGDSDDVNLNIEELQPDNSDDRARAHNH